MNRKPHREICDLCHEVSRVGFSVVDHVWFAALHESQWHDIVCLACFTRLADERGVEWCRGITFHPTSRVAHDRDVCDCREAQFAALRAFAQEVMSVQPGDAIDGDHLQAIATDHGLLEPSRQMGPCGEDCLCAEYVGADEWPVTCLRKTSLLTGPLTNDLPDTAAPAFEGRSRGTGEARGQ